MDKSDNGDFVACAHRELKEEVTLPLPWLRAFADAATLHPHGHRLLRYQHPSRNEVHLVATWIVEVDNSTHIPPLRVDGLRESAPGSLTWRDASIVIANIGRFRFASCLHQMLSHRFPSAQGTDYIAEGCTRTVMGD